MACVFCKIIKGDLPAYKIYEDDYTLAFLDNSPLNEGHTLVVTKEHFSCFDEIGDQVLKNVFLALKKTIKILQEKLDIKDYNIIQNNGRIAGQQVFHVHFHILPRLESDGLDYWPEGSASVEELERVYNKIKN